MSVYDFNQLENAMAAWKAATTEPTDVMLAGYSAVCSADSSGKKPVVSWAGLWVVWKVAL